MAILSLQVQLTLKKNYTLMFVHRVTLFIPANRKSLIRLVRLINSTVASVLKSKIITLLENSFVNFHKVKKALFISAFFIGCLFSSHSQSQTNRSCSQFAATETARIRYIHDGDTLFLEDNRKVRLIGIDTPELARNKNNRHSPKEAYSTESRDFARQLIKQHGNDVRLMAGIEKTDRYGRHLFHIKLSDGKLLQSHLLDAGLAVAYTTPPNQQLSHCYQHKDANARQLNKKIWSHSKYQIIPVSELSPKIKGFHLIQGKVRHIGESKKAFWINFYGNFSARIDKRDMPFFNRPLKQLLEKTITIRGWVRHYKNKAQISLRHPSAIDQ